MMLSSLPLLLLALSSTLSAPAAPYDGYTQVVVPQKRAALVLDRLLIALQKALHEDAERTAMDAPRTAPLRSMGLADGDMMGAEGPSVLSLRELDGPRAAPLRFTGSIDDTSSLQRRGQGAGRGRVLRCYFNAVTCF